MVVVRSSGYDVSWEYSHNGHVTSGSAHSDDAIPDSVKDSLARVLKFLSHEHTGRHHSHVFGNDDTVHGSSKNGHAGRDSIFGDDGRDILDGGKGRDVLTGKGGHDIFQFSAAGDSGVGRNHRDTITDFTAGDCIDVHKIADFTFIADGGFSGNHAELRTRITSHDTTIVIGDKNGDGIADFEIELKGTHHLQAGDFLLG